MIVQIELSFLHDSAVLRTLPLTGSDNTVYAVRFAHLNAFGTSHTPKTLGDVLLGRI